MMKFLILLILLIFPNICISAIPPFANAPSQWSNNSQGINYSKNVGIGSSNPGATLDVNGTVRSTYFIGNTINAVTNVSTNYSILNTDYQIVATGTINITLPSSALYVGRTFPIYNAGTGIITVLTSGSDVIDPAGSSMTISSQYLNVGFFCRASGFWEVIYL